jgi:hypothetical protein
MDGRHTLGFAALMAYFCTQYQNLLMKLSFSLENSQKIREPHFLFFVITAQAFQNFIN